MRKKLLVFLALVALVCIFAACDTTGSLYVTFDAQNSTKPTVVKFDENFALPEQPTKDGFEFRGWYLDKEGTQPWNVSTDKNITVYAKWEAANSDVFVYFDALNGTEPTAVKFDDNFAMPADPTNGTKVFGGWYTDASCTTQWTVPTTLTQSVTVYAKWNEPAESAIYVYFDAQNGSEPIAVKFDDNFAIPADPTNGTKVFGGWFAEASCDNEWHAPATLSQSVTVYAKWFDTADLHSVFDNYDSYDKWNFQIKYTFTSDIDHQAFMDQTLKCYKDDIAVSYTNANGQTVTDYLVYNADTETFEYYADCGDSVYLTYAEDDASFAEYFLNVGYVELTTLNDLAFVQDDDSYVAIDPQTAGNVIFDEWTDGLWYEVRLFVENGKISKITAIQLDTSEYNSGSYTLVAEFSEYDNCQFQLPDTSVENDAELVAALDYYKDESTWNFGYDYTMLDGNEVTYNAQLFYKGLDFKYVYDYEGYTYTDYVGYDLTNGRITYFVDNGDGTYELYCSDSADETELYLFETYYTYVDYVDVNALAKLQFIANGDHYSAQSAIAAGNLLFGNFGVGYKSFDLYVANGKISQIVATMNSYENTDPDTGETTIYNFGFEITFSDYGAVNFTLPNESGSGGGGTTPDPDTPIVDTSVNETVFVDDNLTTENSSSVQYTADNGAGGFDEIRGVQFLQANGAVTLTSESSFKGVTKVKVVVSTNADSGMTVSVKVGGVALLSNGVAEVAVNKLAYNENKELIFVSDTSLDGVVEITFTPKQTKKSMYVSSVTVYCGSEGGGSEQNNVMPNQNYDEQTFDNGNLQDKMFEYEEKEYGSGAIGLPSVGNYSALVVPVQFGSETITNEDLQMLNAAFNGTKSETGWESVNSFYQTSSFGKLNLTFDIWNFNIGNQSGNYTAEYPANHYETSVDNEGYSNGSDVLLAKVLAYLENKIDLTKYDTNNDGYIDAVYLIYNYGVDYNDGDFWWAYTTWYSGEETYDNVGAYYYFFAGFDFMTEDVYGMGNEVNGTINGLKVNASTYIHETGHLLGLDDYYDYNVGVGSDKGLGGADMMDFTVGDHNVYSKIMLGWLEPTIITTTQTFTINLSDEDTSNDCVMLLLDSNNSYFCEYLLIDLYSATGLNQLHANQPGSILYNGAQYGARIYHVSSAISNPYGDEYGSFTDNNNSMSATPLLMLVEADGEVSKSQEEIWSEQSDLWQTGSVLSNVYSNFTRNDGKTVNFDISFDEVTETTATVTITFATAA